MSRFAKKFEYPDLRKFNGKLCTLYIRNVLIMTKIECPELHIFNEEFGTLYIYGMSGFAEKLNVQINVN